MHSCICRKHSQHWRNVNSFCRARKEMSGHNHVSLTKCYYVYPAKDSSQHDGPHTKCLFVSRLRVHSEELFLISNNAIPK